MVSNIHTIDLVWNVFLFKGECPILTGEIAVAFNKGLMGYATLNDTQLEHGIYKVIPVMR